LLTRDDEQLYHVLEVLSNADSPIGARRIQEVIKKDDIVLSEATIGRILQRADSEGFTEKCGTNGGRVITDLGKDKLNQLKFQMQHGLLQNELMKLINDTGLDGMINYLNARKAIESEALLLAVEQITEDELKILDKILREQIEVFNNYLAQKPTKSQAYLDYKFHLNIVRSSHNPYFINFFNILRASDKIQAIFEYIAGQKRIEDHIKIFESLKSRDANKAVCALRFHIDQVIEECKNYWLRKTIAENYLNNNEVNNEDIEVSVL